MFVFKTSNKSRFYHNHLSTFLYLWNNKVYVVGDFFNKVTVSNKPEHAKSNWKKINDKHQKCANCNSINTVCIFDYASGCIIGWDIIEEFFCYDCKKYTTYISEYQS